MKLSTLIAHLQRVADIFGDDIESGILIERDRDQSVLLTDIRVYHTELTEIGDDCIHSPIRVCYVKASEQEE